MKKKLFVFLGLLMGIVGVYADAAAPVIKYEDYEVIITNPEGAYCYSEWKDEHSEEKAEYNKVYRVLEYNKENYFYLDLGYGKKCLVKKDDAKIYGDFNMKNAYTINEKYAGETLKALIIEDNVMMKKGPVKEYDDLISIPKGEVVIFTHCYGEANKRSFYTTYQGKSGWIIDGYGYDGDDTLVTMEDTNIMINNQVQGTIPSLTNITNYLYANAHQLYVNYNGILGYINVGDVRVHNNVKKTSGYIGEGLFGEQVTKQEETIVSPQEDKMDNTLKNEQEEDNNKSDKLIIIGGISILFLLIIIIWIIKRKRNNVPIDY